MWIPLNIDAVLTGLCSDRFGALKKARENGLIDIGVLGLAGDEQADLCVHGGPDKAASYLHDHHAFWTSQNLYNPKLNNSGAFGENISVSGLVETEATIGD